MSLPVQADLPDVREQLLANARALQPVLRERIPETEAERRLPVETIRDFHEAGFWKMLQPKRYGGLEVHPNTFFDVQMTVAEACSSSAWVLGVVAVHAWQLALFDQRAQDEVWGENPETLVSSSYAPTGKVKRVEGGFEISGRWSFSSGCDHCDWVFLGGFAPVEEGSPPDMRTFLVPKSDYVIEDNWHTIALKGTGSKDVVIERAFVPEHRTHKMSDGFRCENPGNGLNDAALYRIPFGQIFTRSVSTTSIGIAAGALDFYKSVTATKVGAADGNRAAQDPSAQMACARAASAIDAAKLILHRNFAEMIEYAERGEKIPLDRRVAWRWDSSEVVSKMTAVVDELFSLCGARALFTNSPMHRYFCDIHGARAHYANRPEASGRNYGNVQLGGRTRDFFL
ncbi:MAG: flavin-dependent monooxygenase [Deltaproteobacteria bacterium]|nr:MAG: flavin-dependent monooxygenase [Deltaproteobacteria bacterium]